VLPLLIAAVKGDGFRAGPQERRRGAQVAFGDRRFQQVGQLDRLEEHGPSGVLSH
jgi:hypothetical protein